MEKLHHSKRSKNWGATRRHPTKRVVQALTAGAAIAAGTQAYAEPIRFNNPSGTEHFDWIPADVTDHMRRLDVMLPADGQPNPGSSAFLQQYGVNPAATIVNAPAGGGIQRGGPYDIFLLGVDAGELIPSGFDFGPEGYMYYPNFGSQLADDQATYLGVRFNPGDGLHYGWIGVVLDPTSHFLDAFAWGYETEPGVPIKAGIPEPGTLAALAFGVAFAGLARRRS